MSYRKKTLLHVGLEIVLASASAAIACGPQAPAASTPATFPDSATPRAGSGIQAIASATAGAPGAGRAASTADAVGGVPTAGSAPAGSAGTGASAPGIRSVEGAPVMPCGVAKALTKHCSQCHGQTPVGGAPMSLATYADFHKPAATNPKLKVFELATQRVNDKARPMPPGGAMPADDLTTLNTWLGAGAPAGVTADATCDIASAAPDATAAGSMEPLVALTGETCYEFKTHGSTASVDGSPYDVLVGEHYANFYFKAPWPDGAVATRYGAKYDNLKVLHHWLFFSTAEDQPEGFHSESPLPTLAGTNATLLAGWAVGGTNLEMPKDVGFELPPRGSQINIQWHFYNSTNTPQTDTSAVQICTVPAGTRPHTASVTWIGTEDLGGNKWLGGSGMPPHQASTYSGTCDPLREGMNANEPIHILGFWPHMHQLGTQMQTFVNRKDGTKALIFDKPFDFNHQIHYLQPYELMPGDTLTAVCHYNNTTNMGVPFGESSDTEMCYQFTFSWPAHALENHVPSLIGATNTCW